MPLRQLYPDPASAASGDAAKVDIIAVHGLNPRSKNDADHAWDTWRTPAGPHGRLWLRDDLPQHVPESRIFLYEYNSTAVYGKDRSTFVDKVNALLEAIRLKRKGVEKRPLLLLGHSLGGLLIKQALINAHINEKYEPIKNAIQGMAFFATPHNGVNKTGIGGVVAKIASHLGFQKGDNLLETLNDGSIFSDIMQEHWKHRLSEYDIVSFWGTLDDIVPRESALLLGKHENIISLTADHSGVCRFSQSHIDQDNFELVQRNIKALCENALKYGGSTSNKAEDSWNSEDLESYNARTVYSPSVELPNNVYQITLADDLFIKISSEQPDRPTAKRISRILPDLLRAFAEKIGYNAPTQMHRDVMFFVHRYRQNITMYFDKCFNKSFNNTGNISLVDKMGMLNEGAREPGDKVNPDPVDELMNQNSNEEVEEHEDEITQTPELLLYREFIFKSPAYEWLIGNLRRECLLDLATPNSMATIRQKIISSLPSSHSISRTRSSEAYKVTFEIEWDPMTFIKRKEHREKPAEAIDIAITLTGSANDWQALTCTEYLCQTWPSTGEHTIQLVKDVFRSEPSHRNTCDLPDKTELIAWIDKSKFMVEAFGTAYSVAEIGEQFAWLGSALRFSPRVAYCTPFVSHIHVDNAPHQASRTRPWPDFICKIAFNIEKCREHFEFPPSWHNINPVKVRGYPIPHVKAPTNQEGETNQEASQVFAIRNEAPLRMRQVIHRQVIHRQDPTPIVESESPGSSESDTIRYESSISTALSSVKNERDEQNIPPPRPVFPEIPYAVTFVDTVYRLGVFFGFFEAPVKPGYLRLCWTCKCGRRFHQDVHQRITNLDPLQSMIQDIVLHPKSGSNRGTYRQSKSLKGAYAKSSTYSDGNTAQVSNPMTASQGESNPARPSSNGSKVPQKNKNPSDQGGIRHRRDQREEQTDCEEEVENNGKKWIIVGLPNEKYKILEHIDVAKSPDDIDLFREMRSLYKGRRNTWQRFLELHDVHKIHLIKFHLRHITKKVGRKWKKQDIPTKTEKYEQPDLNTDRDWELAVQDIGIESLPEFMMVLWHMASEAYDNADNKSHPPDQPWYSRWRRRQPRQTVPHQEPQMSGLPTYESQHRQDQVPRRWQDHVRRVRIYIEDRSPLLSNWLASFRSHHSAADPSLHNTNTQVELINLGIETELDPDAFYVYNEVPKRIRKRLIRDPTRKEPVVGWGLWIEEEFIIPWYALVFLNILPIVALAAGAVESSKHGLTWLAVSAYGLTLSAFVFAQWVAKSKDSKR